MERTRNRRAATALLMGCVLGGGLAPPLGAHAGHEELEHATLGLVTTAIEATAASSAVTVAASAASSMGCPAEVSCGFGCRAKLGSGYCITLFRGTTKNSIGPRLAVECKACDCMYIAPGPNGRVLIRKVEVGCDANFDGLNLY